MQAGKIRTDRQNRRGQKKKDKQFGEPNQGKRAGQGAPKGGAVINETGRGLANENGWEKKTRSK